MYLSDGNMNNGGFVSSPNDRLIEDLSLQLGFITAALVIAVPDMSIVEFAEMIGYPFDAPLDDEEEEEVVTHDRIYTQHQAIQLPVVMGVTANNTMPNLDFWSKGYQAALKKAGYADVACSLSTSPWPIQYSA